jgi:hypothetical protein
MTFIRSLIVMMAATLIFGHTAARAVSEKLNIPPIPQNTAVWCWLAVSEMALRYHGVPNTNPAGIYQAATWRGWVTNKDQNEVRTPLLIQSRSML